MSSFLSLAAFVAALAAASWVLQVCALHAFRLAVGKYAPLPPEMAALCFSAQRARRATVHVSDCSAAAVSIPLLTQFVAFVMSLGREPLLSLSIDTVFVKLRLKGSGSADDGDTEAGVGASATVDADAGAVAAHRRAH